MAEHEPEILTRTDKWLLIEDFVNFMLCGRKATDYTMASCTLLFDQRRLDWSEEMLGAVRALSGGCCATLYPSGTVLGEVTSGCGRGDRLPVGTPVRARGRTIICAARCRWARSSRV